MEFINIIWIHKALMNHMDIVFGDPTSFCYNPVTRILEWITFNMDSKEWNKLYIEEEMEDPPSFTIKFKYIPSPIDQLHVIRNGDHYVISNDIDTEDFAKLVEPNIGIGREHPLGDYVDTKLIYNDQTKMLMAFQEGNEILLCDIHDKDQSEYNWRKSRITLKNGLPREGHHFEPILGWNQILFIFDLEQRIIECIDLNHPQNGQYVNHINEDTVFEFVIKDKNNDIHLLQLNGNDRRDHALIHKKSYHSKVSLFDLIPLEVLKMNQKDYNPLIIGYCKECERDKRLPFIPMYLKQLILKFYPIFI